LVPGPNGSLLSASASSSISCVVPGALFTSGDCGDASFASHSPVDLSAAATYTWSTWTDAIDGYTGSILRSSEVLDPLGDINASQNDMQYSPTIAVD